MPNQKEVVRVALKVAMLLFGMLLLFMFAANYQGRSTYKPDYPFLIGLLIAGLVFVFLGTRRAIDAGSDEVVVASNLQRLANLSVDLLFCRVLVLVLVSYNPHVFLDLMRSYGEGPVSLGLALLVLWIYYFLFEAIIQRTPGKLVTNTVVVTEDLAKPGLLSIVKRTFSRLVPFEPFSIFTATGIWHDAWSKSYVVCSQSLPQSRQKTE